MIFDRLIKSDKPENMFGNRPDLWEMVHSEKATTITVTKENGVVGYNNVTVHCAGNHKHPVKFSEVVLLIDGKLSVKYFTGEIADYINGVEFSVYKFLGGRLGYNEEYNGLKATLNVKTRR
jgi:hypothetical protein